MRDLVPTEPPITWVHYSDRPDEIGMYTREQEWGKRPGESLFFKPKGLWITPENAPDNWEDWCIAEDFHQADLNFVHVVTLRKDANLLVINDEAGIDAFTDTYGMNILEALGHAGSFFRDRYKDGIRWDNVATLYQGILIPNYIHSRRLIFGDHNAAWYYPWDCASGCIWNADAVESIVCRSNVSRGFVSRDTSKDMENLRKMAEKLKS